MAQLTLDQARIIIKEGFAKGAALKLKPLAVAVLDAGGHLKAYEAQDGSTILRFQIAHGKAYGALCFGVGSRRLGAMAAERPQFVAAANALAHGALVPVPGGVLVRDAGGVLIGAVGVSGDVSDNDEACAVVGIEAAGLKADTGA